MGWRDCARTRAKRNHLANHEDTNAVRKSPLLAIFLTIAVDLIGFGIIIPLQPLYALHFGANATMVAGLMAAYSLMQLVFSPIWGRLSDRIGRRPVLLFSIAGNAVALLLMGFAQSYGWLLAARFVAGICTANIAVANAYIADVTSFEKRAKGMGVVGAAFGLGFVIGPFIGGELSHLGYAAPAFFAAGLAACNWIFVLSTLPESLPAEKRHRTQASGWRARWSMAHASEGITAIFALVFAQIFAFSMLEATFVLFVNRRLGYDVAAAGRVFAYVGIVMAAIQGGLIGRLVGAFGERRVAAAGLLCVGVGMGLIPVTPAGGHATLVALITLVAAGQGLVTPSLTSFLSKCVPSRYQGMALGVSQSVSALARFAGPLIAGALYDMGSEDTPFFTGGGLILGAFVGAILALPKKIPAPPLSHSPTNLDASRGSGDSGGLTRSILPQDFG